MDGKRFDDLSRVLGAGLTRQNVFHALAGAGAAGLAAIAGLAGLGEADAKKGKAGHAGKKGRGGGHGDNNRNKGNDGGGGGASAEGKHKKGKGKGKNKKKGKNRQSDSVQASSDKLCPDNQDKVCHCPPGNTGNCQTTGNGGGHGDHDPLDCCCTINGQPNAECECPDGLDLPCCKPLDTACANDSQCCEGVCCDIDSAGIGTCQESCCVPKTCADFDGQCGTFPNGCGSDLECRCPAGQGCCDNQCFEGGDECCVDGDCDEIVCQVADCDNGDCNYAAVPDNQQGPLCTGEDEFCCKGKDCCVSPEICTGSGCCLPKTCADFQGRCGTFDDECGGEITCGCGQDEDCCGGVCITEEQCCETEECQPRLCQNRDCVDHECDYTPVKDNEQGPLCNSEHEFCCGGDECCESPEICTGEGCCLPLTCADFEGKCGTFDNLCGGTVSCRCPDGQGCCDEQCFEGGLECCATADCDAVICQVADCDNGDCTYTAVPDNDQGPLCTGVDQFCCGGDECCTAPQVCFGEGCCTPLTCADYDGQCGTFTDNCGGTVTCGCDGGEQCCEAAKVCVADDACCPGITCDEVICKVADCVGTECNYTPVKDNEQGPLCDEQGEFCCGGDECCESPEICTGTGCCLPKTCAVDYPGECGQRDDGCGGVLNCSCAEGQGCCEGTCVDGLQCCESSDCDALVCREVECDLGECEYTPVEDGQQGPLCTDAGDFCCNGNACCEAGDVCTGEGCCTPLTCADIPDNLCGPQPNGCGGLTADCTCPVPGDTCVQGVCVGCIPETKEEACAAAGRVCGLVSDGCGGEYDCGACSATQTCIAGVCLAKGGKRCKGGTGKAGHPCKGKKCKCKGGRRCNNRRCCEPKGDGSVHCNANSDCCPGLTCLRRQPGQHKVCVRKGSAASIAPTATTTPGIALGAVLTGLLAKGASRLFGAANSDAQIALNDLSNQEDQAAV